MAILDRDRKILWARSGNRCSICKGRIVEAAQGDDVEAIMLTCGLSWPFTGTHIVAEQDKLPQPRSTILLQADFGEVGGIVKPSLLFLALTGEGTGTRSG